MIKNNQRNRIFLIIFTVLLFTFAHLLADEHDNIKNNRPDVYSDLSVIASIDNVIDNQYKIVEFTLKENKILRIFAIGEWNIDVSKGYSMVMSDYGGIENAQTGQLIWEMHRFSTQPAGGSDRNRLVDRILPLPAGTYRLHYRSNSSHSFDNWVDEPPVQKYWGITLFDETKSHQEMLENFWENASTPEEMGWSSNRLNALKPLLRKLGSSALLIVTDNKIVFDWGNTANNFRSHSTRKQLFSGLFGIYVDNGKIDTSKTLKELDIREKVPLTEREKQATVLDLLKARSGVYIPAAAESSGMKRMRPERGSHEPGTFWMYNNFDFNVLGTIFRQETGEDIYEAFDRRIANPIGMQDYILEIQEYGEEELSIHLSYPFRISARDMARFGRLFLNEGKWGGKQIIPYDWLKASTRSYSDTFIKKVGFGYLWWVLTSDAFGMKKGSYFASGAAGQKIFILPEKNTVVVHRLNATTPGIEMNTAQMVPFFLMPRIMKAYTGKKKSPSVSTPKQILPQRQLLKDYENIRQVEGVYYRKSRIIIYSCLAFFFLIIVFYLIRYIVQKVKRTRKDRKGYGLAVIAKFFVVMNALLCIPFVLIPLDNERALEELSIYDLSTNFLNLPSLVHFITQIPKYSIILTSVVILFGIVSWIKKFWSLPERLIYTLVIINSLVFVWITNNMIIIG